MCYVETYTYLSTSSLLIFFTCVNIFYMFDTSHLSKYFVHKKLHRHAYYYYEFRKALLNNSYVLMFKHNIE